MQIKTAMFLAAGRGERLRPLTDDCPKPLLPIHGKPFIVHHLEKCAALGVENVIINVSYLAKKIVDTLGNGQQFGLTIEYSYEETPLGPGGGIRQALPLLGEQPFLLISSDIWTNFPLEKFFSQSWSLNNNLLHAVLTDKRNQPKGDFDLITDKLALSSNPEYIYGSIAIIHPEIFKDEPTGKASLMPAFTKAIQANRATGEYYQDVFNVNTLEEYRDIITL
ncbi:MAG: mannose-phosphate guanyltransferase [Gammaproteobacteria bacterium]|jgi:MurNAc alpha-1-phosphate uridylyltransferase|nr:mannose-phosphate guanyltransferase [Gammaproteobacteria bacterium]